ncbi:uncharacterized protein LOC130826934 isoform X2 [Amaranthus tricolor]|uniref:uncharacterized protein LOC130826934 isoform X2 n=1 Tax=Amaranthus tricolor TaxID=29722 RepID=UPI002585CA00|nr:uncharacterized protein LOC130826934 isoform X2 [Amaranthus tricolor]
MSSLDIAITQSSFQKCFAHSRLHSFIKGTIPKCSLSQLEDRWASFRISFKNTGDLNSNWSHSYKRSHHMFLVKAVATLELSSLTPKCLVQRKGEEKENNVVLSTEEQQSSVLDSTTSKESEEVDEKEKLRRMRISKSNKGNTPWNKGRKHSPETLRRIKERTKLAMQNPKVKMKLLNNVGHVQSRQTREKIAVGVRIGWRKRREKLSLQENCLFDWQNLIAEAARKGNLEEEELQWESYEIINERLKQEWVASIEHRKTMPGPKASKRAPKSLEQRRKIAEAIAAKWADPEYRSRVSSGMAKYYESADGAERKVKRKSSSRSQTPRTPKKKLSSAERLIVIERKVKNQSSKLKKRTAPKYKDPLASSKLEMLKNIRAQRVASEASKNEAVERAKLLIAKARKAAKALEIAALKSPVAQASLVEARNLIAEATRSIESIVNEKVASGENLTLGKIIHAEKDENSSVIELDAVSHAFLKRVNGTCTGIQVEKAESPQIRSEDDKTQPTDDVDERDRIGINGISTGHVKTFDGQNLDVGLYKMPIPQDLDVIHQHQRQIGGYRFPKFDIQSFTGKSETRDLMNQQHSHVPNGLASCNRLTKLQIHEQKVAPAPEKLATKRWVHGRLVDIVAGK